MHRGRSEWLRDSGWYYGPSYGYSYGYGYGYPYGYYMPYYAGYGYGYYAGYPGAYAGPSYAPEVAYIDTDIQPEETAVFLDGEPVGTVDDFDGFPRYLSVTPGKHILAFKAAGRADVTRSIRVPRGALLQLDFTLPKTGDVGKQSATKTDEEIVIPDPSPAESSQTQAEIELNESESGEQDAEGPGFMRIQIKPADASVYLDRELLGSAAKLAGLHGEMRIEAGVHRIEAVRPGFRAGSKRILVGEGEHLTVELELQKEGETPGSPR